MTREEQRAYDHRRYLEHREARIKAAQDYLRDYKDKGLRKPRKKGNRSRGMIVTYILSTRKSARPTNEHITRRTVKRYCADDESAAR